MSSNEAIQITKISANWLPTNVHLKKIEKVLTNALAVTITLKLLIT